MRGVLPATWADFGARFGQDEKLYLGEWRQGFTVHDLRALFFDCQQVAGLRADLARARRDLDRAESQLADTERRAQFYRRQLVNESRLGLALSRVLD